MFYINSNLEIYKVMKSTELLLTVLLKPSHFSLIRPGFDDPISQFLVENNRTCSTLYKEAIDA